MLINHLVISFINIVLLLIALGLFIPIAVLFLESSAALLPRLSENQEDKTPRPSIAVLIPAHNEALVISTTLQTLIPQLKVEDRLIVIADNCSDETAAIARECGATVIERHDTTLRGKGYALDYGLRFLEINPPEVVIVVDADCIVNQGAIEKLARQAKVSGRPVQATYLLEQPAKPEPKDSISALAFMVKNLVRPCGLQQLGLPCLLTGTGMAFPWAIIHQAPLASGNIVEDMQLGLDLALAGNSPLFCPSAKVTGILPQQPQAAESQRRRWEHGHLQTLISQVPRLLKASLVQRRFDLLAIALDLCVPPLSLLIMMWAAMMVTGLLMEILLGIWLPSILLGIEGFLVLTSIISAWAKFGRCNIAGITLLSVPFYIMWKIPLYLAFLIKPQTQWIRTERDSAIVAASVSNMKSV